MFVYLTVFVLYCGYRSTAETWPICMTGKNACEPEGLLPNCNPTAHIVCICIPVDA